VDIKSGDAAPAEVLRKKETAVLNSGTQPKRGLMKKTRRAGIACIIAVFCFTTAAASHAQTFQSLLSFDGTDGSNPYSPLVEGTDGYFYGTTCCGGAYGVGTVFRISRAGDLTTIYSFCNLSNCDDGWDPGVVGLSLATDGNFYGTTTNGGKNNKGTVFKITPSGTLTTLYNFTGGVDGWVTSGLTLGADGNFYGTTEYAGYTGNSYCFAYGCGTLFQITTSGVFTTPYTFCLQTTCTNGANPSGGLVRGNDGNLYGTTSYGGAYGLGTVYKIAPSGTLTTLHSFCSQTNCPDGAHPSVGLVQASNGNFYGITSLDGPHGSGSVFEITPAGVFTTVYGFCAQRNCLDGSNPEAALIQGSDGNLYGTTESGGAAFFGFVFKMTPAGKITPIYNFCSQTNCADGSYPSAALIQATNGKFYGTTEYGGASGPICTPEDFSCGTVFGFSVGLPPSVEAVPSAGSVGRSVAILGDSLTGSTSVTFNGISATFEVVSRSLIKATVPEGATTGTIQVTTPGGTLNSNIAFQVQP
jgi:uncharacterized repeat protein (TIGR03803 family)